MLTSKYEPVEFTEENMGKIPQKDVYLPCYTVQVLELPHDASFNNGFKTHIKTLAGYLGATTRILLAPEWGEVLESGKLK